jgi:hypothetical protein
MPSVYQLADRAVITPDFGAAGMSRADKRAVFAVTLGGNRTIGTATGAWDGQHMVLRIGQDSTGGRTVTWAAGYNFGNTHSRPAPDLTGVYAGPGICAELIFGYATDPGEWWLVKGPDLIPASTALQWPDWS